MSLASGHSVGALGAGDAEAGGREDACLLPGSRKRQQVCREQAQYGGSAEHSEESPGGSRAVVDDLRSKLQAVGVPGNIRDRDFPAVGQQHGASGARGWALPKEARN